MSSPKRMLLSIDPEHLSCFFLSPERVAKEEAIMGGVAWEANTRQVANLEGGSPLPSWWHHVTNHWWVTLNMWLTTDQQAEMPRARAWNPIPIPSKWGTKAGQKMCCQLVILHHLKPVSFQNIALIPECKRLTSREGSLRRKEGGSRRCSSGLVFSS